MSSVTDNGSGKTGDENSAGVLAGIRNIRTVEVFFGEAEWGGLVGGVQRVDGRVVVFEVFDLDVELPVGVRIEGFKGTHLGRECYVGSATLQAVVRSGASQICSALMEHDWEWPDRVNPVEVLENPENRLRRLLQGWEEAQAVNGDFKIAVADLCSWLTHLRFVLGCEEARLRGAHDQGVERVLRDTALSLGRDVIPVLDELFGQFERAVQKVDPSRLNSHVEYVSRLLHPLLLCSPFQRRAFLKPLGYAGDYGLVNMIGSDPGVGGALFARVLNVWFLAQPPAEAHRNRLDYLCSKIAQTVLGCGSEPRPARILSIGCGPALEVAKFLESHPVRANAEFTLLDFNQETLDHALGRLRGMKTEAARGCRFRPVRRSVAQLLKSRHKEGAEALRDLVYCAGLFDYLTDEVCRSLIAVMWEQVAPGGALIVTNVHSINPRRLTMDHVMDWTLIYRDAPQMLALMPPQCAELHTIECDKTGVNIYLEMRRPRHE